MRAVILQPHFLPFIGYFDLMRRADVFVYYDTVQFRRRSWHCRTWISNRGRARWFSASVSSATGSRTPLINVYLADHTSWREQAARQLRSLYQDTRSPAVLEVVLSLLATGPSGLAEWNVRASESLARIVGIRTPTRRSSDLPPFEGDKQLRLIRICRHLSADTYLCGPGSRNYVSEEVFAEHGIRLEWVNYDYSYRLPTVRGEWVYPSMLDMILVRGVAEARQELGIVDGDIRARRTTALYPGVVPRETET